jgi:hypothetical protein
VPQVEEIRQGGGEALTRADGSGASAGADVAPGDVGPGERGEPLPTDPGVDGQDGEPGEPTDPDRDNPLAGLPGFTPSQVSSAAEVPAPAAAAPVPAPGDAILLGVTVVRLTPAAPGELEPLREFLKADEASALNNDEATALSDLIGALESGGVVRVVTRPRLLCNDGQSAAVTVTLTGDAPGAPSEPVDLTLEFTPSVVASGGGGEGGAADARGLVKVDYNVRAARAGADAGVWVEGLGLAIGPRTRVAGTAVVAPEDTFYFVRRVGGVVGGDAGQAGSIELLVLVRPQPMGGELNK